MLKKSRVRLFFFWPALALMLWNCDRRDGESTYMLSGTIRGINSGWVYVRHRQTNRLDSARIEKGVFTISGESKGPEFCNLGTGSVRRREFYFGFFLQPGEMKLTATKDSLYDAAISVEGSPIQDEFKQFQIKMRPIDVTTNDILTIVETSNKRDSLVQKLDELDKTRKEMIWQYSLEHPNSYVSAFEASTYLTGTEDLPKLDSIFNNMNPELKKWFYSEKINKWLLENRSDGKKDTVKI